MREIRYKSPWWLDTNGYRAATVMYSGVAKTTTLYEHREIMEKHLGRKLRPDEHVHHKDGNKLNNKLSNLEIKIRAEHARFHAKRVPLLKLVCRGCGKQFLRKGNDERHSRKMGRFGPFCGKSCAGRWSRLNQIRRGINLGKKHFVHGTDSAYGYHRCRCKICTEAHRVRVKRWRTNKGG